jgi:hypothetical protein
VGQGQGQGQEDGSKVGNGCTGRVVGPFDDGVADMRAVTGKKNKKIKKYLPVV